MSNVAQKARDGKMAIKGSSAPPGAGFTRERGPLDGERKGDQNKKKNGGKRGKRNPRSSSEPNGHAENKTQKPCSLICSHALSSHAPNRGKPFSEAGGGASGP